MYCVPALCKLDPWQVVTHHSILIIGSVPTQLSLMPILSTYYLHLDADKKCDEVLTLSDFLINFFGCEHFYRFLAAKAAQ